MTETTNRESAAASGAGLVNRYCGQRCGPVQAAADATLCPQCGNPFTDQPGVSSAPLAGAATGSAPAAGSAGGGEETSGPGAAETPAAAGASGGAAGAPGETIGGAAIVSTAPLAGAPAVTVPAAAGAQPAPTDPDFVRSNLIGALTLAGFPPAEAAELAGNALEELARRKANPAGESSAT